MINDHTLSMSTSPTVTPEPVSPFDFSLRTRALFENGALARVGELAAALGFRRTLLVADQGLAATSHVTDASEQLRAAGIEVALFHDFGVNPDTRMIEAGRIVAAEARVDSLVALGGGSSLDCAKGINFVLSGSGTMRDYWGFGKARAPMLPAIGIPTTAGTGSEAQSYAVISDAETHVKMACGDPKAAFRIALLDPTLTLTQPREVTATSGYDALAHAVESYVTTGRTAVSDLFARGAWRLLAGHYERVLQSPGDLAGRGAMLVGAHEAGIAIEQSMLGAAHACANPLTARYGTAHGIAVSVMLPHVVRWNSAHVGSRYQDLLSEGLPEGGLPGEAGERLAAWLEILRRAGGLPEGLGAIGVTREHLPALADDAATQWTGKFNPRPFDAAAALGLYEQAF